MIRQITQVSDAFFMMNFARTIRDFHLFCSYQNVTSGGVGVITIRHNKTLAKKGEIKVTRDLRVRAEININGE